MAAYNSAIYMGRALSFAAVIVAGKLGMAKSTGDIGVTMVRSLNGHVDSTAWVAYKVLLKIA